MGALTFCCSFLLKVICRLCVIYVGGNNDFNVQAMITRLMWTIWTSLSAVRERPLNLITHSLLDPWGNVVVITGTPDILP